MHPNAPHVNSGKDESEYEDQYIIPMNIVDMTHGE